MALKKNKEFPSKIEFLTNIRALLYIYFKVSRTKVNEGKDRDLVACICDINIRINKYLEENDKFRMNEFCAYLMNEILSFKDSPETIELKIQERLRFYFKVPKEDRHYEFLVPFKCRKESNPDGAVNMAAETLSLYLGRFQKKARGVGTKTLKGNYYKYCNSPNEVPTTFASVFMRTDDANEKIHFFTMLLNDMFEIPIDRSAKIASMISNELSGISFPVIRKTGN